MAVFSEQYAVIEMKGSFPYEMVKGVSDLYKPGLPTHTDFYSLLRGETISVEAYDVVEQAWRSNEMRTLFDLLKWYLLLEAVLVYLAQYEDRG